MIEHTGEIAHRLVNAEFFDQGRDPFHADTCGTKHGTQIAVLQVRGARVQHQHLPQILADLAGLNQFEHRQAHAFGPGVGRDRVIRTGSAAADIGLMRPVTGEADHFAANKYRARDHPVGQMVATRFPRVVQQVNIAFGQFVTEITQDGADAEPAAAGMDRNPVGLADDFACRPRDETGKIMRLAEDRATRSAYHHPAHLVGDVIEAVLGQCQDNRVEGFGF